MPIRIICPGDGTDLEHAESGYRCPRCGVIYPLRRGVLDFLGEPDSFYEGAYLNQVRFEPASEAWWHTWPLWLINSGYVWETRKHVPAGATVLELGCAGGVKYFGQRYRMIGCDLSSSSLEGVARSYELCIQADATRKIPLAANSVDAAISSYFWEHLSVEMKSRLLVGLYGVLRPGAKMLFLYDLDTGNPLIERFKQQDPSLYKKLFLDNDGHVGYQSSSENRAIFEAHGFKVLKCNGLERSWLQGSSVYSKLSAWPGRHPLLALGSALSSGHFFYPWTAVQRIFDSTLERLLPYDWSRIELLVLQKA